ncbi:MAG TPA: hypothetical protein PKB06_04230, partial [Actinotalea sp.]|nr:hypothetical protein [Actinotalea sp.]
MSEASDRAAALMAGPPGDDLAAGARVRTQLAVGAAAAALLRAQDPPVGAGDLTGGGGRGAGAGDPGARGDGAGGDGAGGDGAGPRRTAGPVRWLVGPRLAVGAGV